LLNEYVEIKKPPTAFAGGGLGDARGEKSVCQASIPAHKLGPMIRLAGIDAQAGVGGN
jgi:hypothetical protein